MSTPYPGGRCEPCLKKAHKRCLGWTGPVWCGCAAGLCELRLITGLHVDADEPEGDDE